jgi:hypothetical protein
VTEAFHTHFVDAIIGPLMRSIQGPTVLLTVLQAHAFGDYIHGPMFQQTPARQLPRSGAETAEHCSATTSMISAQYRSQKTLHPNS